MAKYVLSLPVILFPYTLLFALCCLYTGFLMEPVFQNNGYLLLLALALCFVVAAVFAVIVAVGAIARASDGVCMARLTMVIKFCHVPAYVAIFVLGILFTLSVWGILFVVVFVLFDCAAIGMTGLIGAAAVYRNYREKHLPAGSSVLFGIVQFVFCADLVACVMSYARSRKAARAPRMES